MEYKWEPLVYLLNTGLAELGERSWQETGNDKGLCSYNPDWERYKRMEDENILRFMAVREEGNLVGYASVIMTSSFHDKDVICAIVQDFFLAPESRKGFAGVKLFWVLEEHLKNLGVKQIAAAERLMVSADKGGVGKVFEYLDFHCNERIWTKCFIEGNA